MIVFFLLLSFSFLIGLIITMCMCTCIILNISPYIGILALLCLIPINAIGFFVLIVQLDHWWQNEILIARFKKWYKNDHA